MSKAIVTVFLRGETSILIYMAYMYKPFILFLLERPNTLSRPRLGMQDSKEDRTQDAVGSKTFFTSDRLIFHAETAFK